MLVLLLLSNMEISNGNKSSSCSLSPIVYQSCNYRLITINQVTGVNQWKPAEQLSQPYFNRVPAGQTMIFRSCCLGSACHLTNALIFLIIFKSVRQLLPYALRLQLSHTSPSKPLPKLPSLLPPLPSLNWRALTQEHEAQRTPGPADSLMHYTTLSTLSPLTVTSPQLPAPSRGQSPTESPACCSDSDMAQTAARCCQTRTEQHSPADAPTSLTFLFCACTAAITHPHHSLSYLPPKCWSSHSKTQTELIGWWGELVENSQGLMPSLLTNTRFTPQSTACLTLIHTYGLPIKNTPKTEEAAQQIKKA